MGTAVSLLCTPWAWGKPEVILDGYAGFQDSDTLALQEFALQGGMGFADQEFTACADYSVPRNAFSGRGRRHRSACGSRSASQAQ